MTQNIHFGYHKCLTVYYMRVMQQLSAKFDFFYKHYEHDHELLQADYYHPQSEINVYGASSNTINKLNINNIRGSHFIRNPLDLLVSAYFYHKKCEEEWCVTIRPNHKWITSQPQFYTLMKKSDVFPGKLSYQEYLNSLSFEDGFTLEMYRSRPLLRSMLNWDFNNPNIIEFRYENIIGHEVEVFEQIFKHYGFSDEIIEVGKRIADRFSLKERSGGDDKHIRSGKLSQWKEHFTPELIKRFKLLFPGLLEKTGYLPEDW